MKSENRASASKVRVRLVGLSQGDVDDLSAILRDTPGVQSVGRILALHASGVPNALNAVLSDVTLVAQIGKQFADVAASVGVVVALVKRWRDQHPPNPSQRVDVTTE